MDLVWAGLCYFFLLCLWGGRLEERLWGLAVFMGLVLAALTFWMAGWPPSPGMLLLILAARI